MDDRNRGGIRTLLEGEVDLLGRHTSLRSTGKISISDTKYDSDSKEKKKNLHSKGKNILYCRPLTNTTLTETVLFLNLWYN